MSRVIKYRAWDKREGLQRMYFLTGIVQYGEGWSGGNPEHKFYELHFGDGFSKLSAAEIELMQFTGKKCFNNKEVYEGDILFYEEQSDNGDERFYLVVTWIEEWCMFASLHVEEYHKYLSGGAKELDEVLYWTYPIEESEDYHYAGNIYQNPELL